MCWMDFPKSNHPLENFFESKVAQTESYSGESHQFAFISWTKEERIKFHDFLVTSNRILTRLIYLRFTTCSTKHWFVYVAWKKQPTLLHTFRLVCKSILFFLRLVSLSRVHDKKSDCFFYLFNILHLELFSTSKNRWECFCPLKGKFSSRARADVSQRRRGGTLQLTHVSLSNVIYIFSLVRIRGAAFFACKLDTISLCFECNILCDTASLLQSCWYFKESSSKLHDYLFASSLLLHFLRFCHLNCQRREFAAWVYFIHWANVVLTLR